MSDSIQNKTMDQSFVTQFTILMRGLSLEMRRRPSYLYMNKDKKVIIVDPLFPHLIPSNPPQYHG